MNAVATTVGVNRWALMALPSNKPRTTAGTQPITTFRVKRCAWGCEVRPSSVARRRCQYTMITAKIAPVWIAISNTLARSS